MQLESDGKITKVIRKNNNISLEFDNYESIKISFNQFCYGYYYVGKKISSDEYEEILKASKYQTILQYAIKILSSRIYTEQEIAIKLKDKGSSSNQIDDIMNILKSMNLIDDKRYALEYHREYSEKLFGKKNIISSLLNKGIKKYIIEQLNFDNEEEKANLLLPIYLKKYENQPFKKKKSLIYEAYLRRGFSNDVALNMINSLKQNQYEDEVNCKKMYTNLKLHMIPEDKIIKKLLNKGYSYELINSIRKEDN